MRAIWKKHRKAIIVGAILAVALVAGLIWAVNVSRWPDWAGVNGKTAWDLLDLLIVPAVLAIGGFLFTWAQRRAEGEVELDRQREAALQTYLDRMTELLLENDLATSEPKDKVRDVARTWTMTTLRRLDGERKGILLRFLYESYLIINDTATINLDGADLSGTLLIEAELVRANLRQVNLIKAFLIRASLIRTDLTRAKLVEANLVGAYLRNANLCEADLHKASLIAADLTEAHLIGVNLSSANLFGAQLIGADLSRATLIEADLRYVDLSRAKLIKANLSRANLTGAKYDRHTKWPEGFDPASAGAIPVDDSN